MLVGLRKVEEQVLVTKPDHPILETHTSLLVSPQQTTRLPFPHAMPCPEPLSHLLVGVCSRAVLTETLCSLSVQLMPLMKLQHSNISVYHEMFIMWNNEVGWSTHSPAADSTEYSERPAFPGSSA